LGRTGALALCAILGVTACASGRDDGTAQGAQNITAASGAGVATNTKEVRLGSSDGAQITITYHSLDPEGDTQAKAAVTVNLHTPLGSNCLARARATFATHCGQAPTFDTTSQVDLITQPSDSGGGCFFENPDPATILYLTHAGICAQEIAIDVDGGFLVDPVNGTHNFKYTLEPTGF
jgi:hypothetical protein